MTSESLRARARAALAGRWKELALITLIYNFISSAAANLYIGSLLVAGPLSVAFAGISMKVLYGERVSVDNIFDGFKYNFVNNFLLGLVNSLLIALWSLLLVVPGVIKSCAYSMSYYIMNDNPGISQSEARRRSEEMMMGHKMEYFMLSLSFIGWILLSLLTLGIGLLFVLPYMQVASAAFYDNLKIGRFVGENFSSHGFSTNGSQDGESFTERGGEDSSSSRNVFDGVFGSSKSSKQDDGEDGNTNNC